MGNRWGAEDQSTKDTQNRASRTVATATPQRAATMITAATYRQASGLWRWRLPLYSLIHTTVQESRYPVHRLLIIKSAAVQIAHAERSRRNNNHLRAGVAAPEPVARLVRRRIEAHGRLDRCLYLRLGYRDNGGNLGFLVRVLRFNSLAFAIRLFFIKPPVSIEIDDLV